MLPFRRPPAAFAGFALGLATWSALPGAPAEPLATAAEVLSLTAQEAGGRMRIAITGVVTAAEPDWSGQFFVQDGTGGVFVENLQRAAPAPGDLVTVTGVSHPGAFAPIVSEPRWEKTAVAPLPAARVVPIERLQSGAEDGQRVEITGVVRTVAIAYGRLDLHLAVGGYRLQVRAPVPTQGAPEALIAARVRVRGTAASHYNAALRHLTSVAVYVPRPEDFVVEEPEPGNPFTQPAVAINTLAQYRRETRSVLRVHVRGALTLQRPGQDLYLQDGSGGIRIEGPNLAAHPRGTALDAAGFLEFEQHLPVLRDATVRPATAAVAAVVPRPASRDELRNGWHDAELITLRGRVLDHSILPRDRAGVPPGGIVATWLVQGDGLAFIVQHEADALAAPLRQVTDGCVVELDGVCTPSVDTDGKLKSLQVLLPAATDLRVVQRPSWLTPGRLLIGLAVLSVLLLAVVGWSLTVSRKNAALRDTLRQLEQAQRELQEAHDTLEQKVAERSAQLQVQMTERKAAELQFKAVLAERTRLARDLHDSLEQTLTGIALQLDTAARLFAAHPAASEHHLQLARHWLRQSQVELRRSIWDLRSRELEQFDLARALRQSAEHLTDGTALILHCTTEGPEQRLPEVVEENVLRIGQEAVTNAVKHAQAQALHVTLAFLPAALRLRVQDDGRGFVSPRTPAASDGHFGLLGMAERAKRLGGTLAIESRLGHGTTITVEIPLLAAAAPSPRPPETLPA
jgi:signal transduction histidine kinase